MHISPCAATFVSSARCGSGSGLGCELCESAWCIACKLPFSIIRLSGIVSIVFADLELPSQVSEVVPLICGSILFVFAPPFRARLDGPATALVEDVPFPHVQRSCERNAGFGKVLYVDPRDVYLCTCMRK